MSAPPPADWGSAGLRWRSSEGVHETSGSYILYFTHKPLVMFLGGVNKALINSNNVLFQSATKYLVLIRVLPVLDSIYRLLVLQAIKKFVIAHLLHVLII